MKVTRSKRKKKVHVVADDTSVVSRAGSALLSGLADRVGLTDALSGAMASTRSRRAGHDPGVVLRDLAVMLADGGDALCDLGALRDQPDLFGGVASDSTAWRVIDSIDDERLQAIRDGRGRARSRAWDLGVRPDEVVLDIDATLVTSHSDKQDAAATYKRGFGFHPIVCHLDETTEALAGMLRPGNAGANTAADNIRVLAEALCQIPEAVREDPARRVLVRADSAGATHGFLDAVRQMGCGFSVGFDLTEPVRKAVLALPEGAWSPALTTTGAQRKGAQVAEIFLPLPGWPGGSRTICRRERPHPGAQLSFTDHEGHRFQVFLTDQDGDDVAPLELRHRGHARIEDRIRCAKDTGLRNLPFHGYAANAVWIELVLIAQDLIAWAQTLLLDGELARAEPKRLRYRLLHTAGRLTRSARRVVLHLSKHWTWANPLVRAFVRLHALPAPAG